MNIKIIAIGFLMIAGFTSFNAKSAVMTSGCLQAESCTLDELLNGGTIDVGGVNFEWSDTLFENYLYEYDNNDIELDGQIDISNIIVQGIDAVATANPNEFTLGLLFDTSASLSLPPFSAANDVAESELELDFEYSATSTDGQIVGARLEMLDVSLGADNSAFAIQQTLEGLFDLEVAVENDQGTRIVDEVVDEAMLAGFSGLDLSTNIQGDTFGSGSASLSSFAFYFTVVRQAVQPPNNVASPSILLLSLLGFCVLIFSKRKH